MNVGGRPVVTLEVERDLGPTWPATLAATGRRMTDRREAFAGLVERQLDGAYRLAAVILGDAVEAEDAVHDAALAAWRSRELLRDEARFEAWFTRIVVNGCRDRLRARKRHSVVDIEPVLPNVASRDAAWADPAAVTASRDALGRALRVLEPDELVVVILRFYRDLPVDAIADRLAIPPGTVKSRLHTAMRRLRGALASGEVDR
jgi:RNA polymerase sigma-70 factor (ECF subfamily)